MPGPFNFTAAALLNDVGVGLSFFAGVGGGDVVQIIDPDTLQQIFENARPILADIDESQRVMEHPVESGASIADFRVIDPKNLTLSLIIPAPDFTSTYEQIRTYFTNAQLVSVQTKTDVYQNLLISRLPHREDPEKFDVITLTLHLREVLYVPPVTIASQQEPANFAPANPTDASTVQRGAQSPTVIPGSFSSATFGNLVTPVQDSYKPPAQLDGGFIL